jgi:rhomboid family GlyGly-CTERM serine protease
MEEPKGTPGAAASHAFFAALAATALALAAVPAATPALSYVRAAIRSGEIWRLLTGHLVHGTVAHLAWNLAGLALVWLAFGTGLGGRAWTLAFLASALGTGLGVFLFAPDVAAMLGLSGALHGLLSAGAVAAVRSGERLGWAFVTLLAAKLAWEQLAGASPTTEALLGGAIAVDAHLYGSLAGAAAGALVPPRRAA